MWVWGIVVLAGLVTAIDNGLGRTPPMGWRSWNCYHGNVDDAKMRATIDAMTTKNRTVDGVPTSLSDLGYIECGLDDNWQACGKGVDGSFHDAQGNPIINTKTFPNMKAMTAYAHGKGLRIGWYHNNCICSEHQFKGGDIAKHYQGDVNAIVGQEWDGVKLDGCGEFRNMTLWAELLNKTGRPILIENCHWGRCTSGDDSSCPTLDWCPMNFYRTSGDISASWGSMFKNLQTTRKFQDPQKPLARPGCWAYPDMLEVGNLASHGEDRAHFAAWCIVSAPLVLGLDLTNTKNVDSVWDIISNKEVIKVNQQWVGHPGMLVKGWTPNGPTTGEFLWGVDCSGSDPTQKGFSYDSTSKAVKTSHGCLDSSVESELQAKPCDGSKAQQFTYTGSQLKAENGKCVDVYDFSGPVVQLFSCNGGANQKFTFNPDHTVSDGQKKCLAVRNIAPNSGDALQLWAKPQPNKAWAVLILNNQKSTAATVTVELSWLNVTSTVGVRDLFEHKDLPKATGSFTTDSIPGHDSRMFLLTPQ